MYTYTRDPDGTEDAFYILAPNGRILATRHFWDEADTDHAITAEADVKLIVTALNTCDAMSKVLKSLT